MPNYRRWRRAGSTFFFTLALERRGSGLLVAEIARLREAFRRTQAERRFSLDAVVVLPDHLHAVLTLAPGDADYATLWRLVKTRFSHGLPMGSRRPSHLARGERGLWQRRFWEHLVRDEADYAAHVAYCWANPVKHGLVGNPMDWPYSSLHRDHRLGLVPPEWQGIWPEGPFGE
ncbi:MAG: transposase [Pseudomonadota bacterium]